MNNLNVLRAFSETISTDAAEKIPPAVLAFDMELNSSLLKAAVIDNGGELLVSYNAFYNMITNDAHVVAVANEDGSIRLSLAAREEIMDPKSDLIVL